MKDIHVVTSFLTNDGEILILKRSNSVGSYQGRWAGVSGFLEGDELPLDRARMEIEEETGNKEPRLGKEGKPIEVMDEESDTNWILHPFLFHVDSREIILDWEHTSLEWIKPEDLSNYSTVPKLQEALDRVWGS